MSSCGRPGAEIKEPGNRLTVFDRDGHCWTERIYRGKAWQCLKWGAVKNSSYYMILEVP